MGASTAISELESVHKIEYLASDLNTPSVTLFPSRAQVYREIKGVQLKRGTNEVTIVGLSQTVDSDSIKVESNGSATITNLEVEAVNNRQLFHEVYPESDSDSESESDEEFSDDEAKAESWELKSAKDSLQESRDALAAARDSAGNAQRRLGFLEGIGIISDRKNGDSIQTTLEQYRDERKKAFQDLTDSNNLQKSLTEDVEKAEKKYNKLKREEDKKNAKENKAKAQAKKEREKKKALKDRLKGEAKRERQRLRDEQQQFWPLQVYSLRITLEVAAFTPMTSRRGSTSSDVDAVKVTVAEAEGDEDVGPVEVDLAFSYVTSAAYWTPAYDLQLSTTNASATLYFDAMLTNQTSESWKSCKVTLSTSQATFSSLYDTIPTLIPWRIKLAKSSQFLGNNPDITRSNEEMSHSSNRYHAPMVLHQDNRNRRMMARKSMVPSDSMVQVDALRSAPRTALFGGAPAPPPPPPAPVVSAAFGGGAAYGSAAPGGVNPFAQQQIRAQQQAQQQAYQQQAQQQNFDALQSKDVLNDFDFDSFLNTDNQGGFDSFEASLVEETGLTTTYDLPGLKTLVPKFNGSKQRVARIPFSNVIFSHTVVAKYKPMAYLKAKLKNTSKMALLKGSASLTLDGTFMGKTSLPRCSSGESFSLSLGVDPAIKVTYPKPDVRRASVGLFTKEDSAVYIRTIELNNTRAVGGRAVNLLVLDQVPISEDERLRVELAYPRGLSIDSANGVAVGEPGKTSKDENWGKASAKLKKDGQVTWDVNLNAGKTVKLTLEYAVAMPSGETAYQV